MLSKIAEWNLSPPIITLQTCQLCLSLGSHLLVDLALSRGDKGKGDSIRYGIKIFGSPILSTACMIQNV